MNDKNKTIERADVVSERLLKEKKLTLEAARDLHAARYGNKRRAEKILKKYENDQSNG